LIPGDTETETVVISETEDDPDAAAESEDGERRFTAPGFDAKETAVIDTPPEPATEVFASATDPDATVVLGVTQQPAPTKSTPPRLLSKLRTSGRFTWGWVLAIVVIVVALAAISILGTMLLMRAANPNGSPEQQVRQTIEQYDIAVQRGDLSALRGMTCGATRDGYADYDDHAWADLFSRVSAARQYPVIASIDQVVVNGEHAEANVTAFMAYDPQVRSTRSLDLQYRDNQWKICQSSGG
ncbi:MAG: hypothetical protein WCI78_12490, partial [Mycobacterium sp.]